MYLRTIVLAAIVAFSAQAAPLEGARVLSTTKEECMAAYEIYCTNMWTRGTTQQVKTQKKIQECIDFYEPYCA